MELRERRRSNNLHTLYDIQGHYMHFDASFYLNRHIHVRYINHNLHVGFNFRYTNAFAIFFYAFTEVQASLYIFVTPGFDHVPDCISNDHPIKVNDFFTLSLFTRLTYIQLHICKTITFIEDYIHLVVYEHMPISYKFTYARTCHFH